MTRFHSSLRVLGIVFALTLAVAASGERAAVVTGSRSSGVPTQASCEDLRISAADLEFQLGSGDVVVIDVRNPFAYDYAHLRGALSIPLESLQAAVGAFKSSDVRFVVYGDEGDGLQAATTLRLLGFANARALDGGLPRWVAEGNVVVVQPLPEF